MLNQEQVFGIIRHVFTFLGGFLVMRGYTDEETILELTGGVTTVVGVIWSFVAKIRENKQETQVETQTSEETTDQ